MVWDLFLWLISFFVSMALLAVVIYQFHPILVLSESSWKKKWFSSHYIYGSQKIIKPGGCFLLCHVPQLICLSDLEYDCINPYDSSSRINAVVIPEFIVQGTLCALYLVTWHWFMFLITAPVMYYHIRLYMKRQHFVDVTEIFRLLNGEKKHRMVKLAFYLLLFFIVVYRLVATSVLSLFADEDIRVHESRVF